jgi:hypothetical protein
MSFFTEIETSILKFIWKNKRPPNIKSNPEQNNNVGFITIPYFQLYYRNSSKNNMVHKQTQRPMEPNGRHRNKIRQIQLFNL